MAGALKPKESAIRTIGKYEVLGTLGRGSMGIVYKARDPEIGRVVAVKALRNINSSQYHDTDLALQRFRTEAKSAGNLRHPNIITIFEVNRDREIPYLVMDYVEGESLDVILSKAGSLPPALCIHYLTQIAAGLDHAHQRGVIHRDIKPSNIIVDKGGSVFILDFGVATISESFMDDKSAASNTGIVGTPSYMSPEQILNEPLDLRSDLFSFATMAFECFTGQRPFPGDNFNTVIGNILNGKPLPLSMLNPALPLTLEAEFERALAKEAQQRFNSARATVEAFAEALGIDKKEAEKAGAGHNLPDLPRKRPSSGWKTVIDLASRRKQAESNQTDSPGYTPASGQDNSPWRYVDRPINWREDSPSGRVLRNTPGAIFSGSATEELSKAGNLSRFDFGSPLVRRLIKLSLLACFGLVGTLIWVLSDYDFDRNPVKVPAQKLSRNSALKPVENPAIEHSARIELPAPGKAITELKNAELLGVISDRNQSEERIVGALAEAGNRSIPAVIEVISAPLSHDSFVVRVAAIKVISESADSRAVPLLVPLIDDYDPLVRGHAAKALGRLGNKSALGYLMTRYKSENFPQVKQALKKSIERINGFPLKD